MDKQFLLLIGYYTPTPSIIDTIPVPIYEENFKTTINIPVFDYAPPTRDMTKPRISLALVRPRFIETFKYQELPLFSDFTYRMAEDFKELLNARNYSFRGPFDQYDEMVYNDKVSTDMILSVAIDLMLIEEIKPYAVKVQLYANQIWSCDKTEQVKAGTRDFYLFKGKVQVKGSITVIASEPMTQEKVWTKSIAIKPQELFIESDKKYSSPYWESSKDPGFMNPIAELLKSEYNNLMNKAWTYLEPAELERLLPQIDQIRIKSGYGRRISR